MKKTLFVSLLLLLFVASSSFSVTVNNDISSRITKAIIGFLVNKDPSYEGKKIEVTYKYADRTFRELRSRSAKLEFSVVELYPDFKPVGNIIVPIQVIEDGVPKDKLFLRTKVSVYDSIVVAKKHLKRGDVIGTAEAGMETMDVSTLNSQAIRDIDLVLGKETKTFVPQGNPIYEYMIKERPMVKKNERVKILAYADGISVEADGVALEDGILGAQIRVKNTASNKEMFASITGSGEVTVK